MSTTTLAYESELDLAADGKLLLSFPYSREAVEEARHIDGRWYDPERGLNTYPQTIAAAQGISAFVRRHRPVRVSDEAAAVMRKLLGTDERGQRVAEPVEEAPPVDLEIPGLGGTLRNFQLAGVDYILKHDGRVLLADSMGTGKTAQALAAAQAMDAFPLIVVAPAAVKLSWSDHVTGPVPGAPDGWLPGRTVKVIGGRDPRDLPVADVYVLNYDILPSWVEQLKAVTPQGLVLDESHYAKAKSAGRTKAAMKLAAAIPSSGMILALSGTPLKNKPKELVSQLAIIRRVNDFGGEWNFLWRYCGAFQMKIGIDHETGEDKLVWNFDGSSNEEELNRRLREVCMIRRTKAEVMPELGEKNIVRVPVELSNADEYARAEDDLIAWLQDEVHNDPNLAAMTADMSEEARATLISEVMNERSDAARRAEHLVKINALRTIAARGKLEGSVGWIKNFLESTDEKLIVFADHKVATKGLMKAFPKSAHVLADDSSAEKAEQVRKFQADPKCRLVVCGLMAAGIGITLTAASSVAFIELGWTPADHDQAEDRAHRMGQTKQVTAYYLLADGTIDDDQYQLIEAKREVTTAVTDGKAVKRQPSVMAGLEARLLARA